MNPFCFLCFMFFFAMLYGLSLATLWSPTGKGLTSWLSCVGWDFLCAFVIFLSGVVLDCIDS